MTAPATTAVPGNGPMNTGTHLRADFDTLGVDALGIQGENSLERFATGDRYSLVRDADETLTLRVQSVARDQGAPANRLPAGWNPPPLAVVARATS